jgi:arginine N-succinyltransferase
MSSVRLATPRDIDGLLALAETADVTMTTVPRTREEMSQKIAEAVDSARPDREVDGHETYLFVLEEEGRILGMSAIYAAVGLDRPFYSYKVSSISQASPELNVRVDTSILHLVNDFTGNSVVGTLYLHPDARGGGRGRLLSLSRFIFMAAHRDRFGPRVIAEMRGVTDPEDGSVFWNAVGRRFFQLDFSDADLRSGHEFRFISDLFPTYPIYADLLPTEAQAVIGKAHPDSVPAARLLQEQGMRDHGYVDIFDAGLCLDAFIDDLEIVRASSAVKLTEAPIDPADAEQSLIATTGLGNFIVVMADASVDRGQVSIDQTAADECGWAEGQELMVAPARRVSTKQGKD